RGGCGTMRRRWRRGRGGARRGGGCRGGGGGGRRRRRRGARARWAGGAAPEAGSWACGVYPGPATVFARRRWLLLQPRRLEQRLDLGLVVADELDVGGVDALGDRGVLGHVHRGLGEHRLEQRHRGEDVVADRDAGLLDGRAGARLGLDLRDHLVERLGVGVLGVPPLGQRGVLLGEALEV